MTGALPLSGWGERGSERSDEGGEGSSSWQSRHKPVPARCSFPSQRAPSPAGDRKEIVRGPGKAIDLKFPQQALDVIELELRPLRIGEAPAQLLEDAARPLHVDLAGNFHRHIVAEIVAAHRAAERIGVLLRAGRAVAARLSGAPAGPLLHLLGHALRALAQCLERAALGVDRAVGILLAESALGIAHGFFR